MAWRWYFSVRTVNGALVTSWAGADSEVSLDGGAFSDCTDEATEIGSSGCGYLDLTASETNADAVLLKITVTNSLAMPIVVPFYPEELGDYRVDSVKQTGDAYARLGAPAGASVSADIAALSVGAGSGGNSIAVTVTDSVTTDPIENAVVTLQRTGETAHDTTDVDGETALAVTSATFQLIVTAAGYVGYSEPLVVTASASVSVDLTPIVVGATDPGQTTGSITVYDLSGAVVSGAVVTLKLISLADGTVGVGITPSVRTATTNGSGIATFDGLPRLARYTLNVDGGATSSSGVTADAPTTNLLSVIGPTA